VRHQASWDFKAPTDKLTTQSGMIQTQTHEAA